MTHPRPGSRRTRLALVTGAALLTTIALAVSGTATATVTGHGPPDESPAVDVPDNPDATQPAQPLTGPGGSQAAHARIKVTSGGSGPDAWFVFEPRAPRPATAPVAVVMHGYYEFEGYDALDELIRHTVLRGSIVIYPRWQTGIATPCPGPYDIEPCMDSAVAGIRGALRYLEADRHRVQPRVDRVSYWGSSFGGIITANLANRYRDLDLPKPRAIFLEDPHDGGLAGLGEPALDDSLAGIPRSTRIQCHSGADGVISGPGMELSSCNAVFPLLEHVPDRNKDLVLTHTDTHGEPDLSSEHMVCYSRPGTADAYDYNFCWKVWDALRSSAYRHTYSPAAFGDTPQHRSLGVWSDGTPIAPLTIQDGAPIAP